MLTDEYIAAQLKIWKNRLNEVFRNAIPDKDEWKNLSQISEILNIISKENTVRMIFPDGTDIDIDENGISYRKGLIEIQSGEYCNLCCPALMSFDMIDGEPGWSYFRLELKTVERIGEGGDICSEQLIQNADGSFEKDRENINEYQRHVTRILNGTLLMIPKVSDYVQMPSTESRSMHNVYNRKDFRHGMENMKHRQNY